MGRPKKELKNEATPENNLKNEAPAENTTLNENVSKNILIMNTLFNGKHLKAGDEAPADFMAWLNKANDKNSTFVR